MVLSSAGATLTLAMLIDGVLDTIASVVCGKDWAQAFFDVGLVGHQRCVSDRTLEKCSFQARPAIDKAIPSLQQLQSVFPRNMHVPIDAVFRTLTKSYTHLEKSVGDTAPARAVTRSMTAKLRSSAPKAMPSSSSAGATSPRMESASIRPRALPPGAVVMLRRLPSKPNKSQG